MGSRSLGRNQVFQVWSLLATKECPDDNSDATGRSEMAKLILGDSNPNNLGFEKLGTCHKGLIRV